MVSVMVVAVLMLLVNSHDSDDTGKLMKAAMLTLVETVPQSLRIDFALRASFRGRKAD
jgi:hypothetical protein